MVRVLASGIHEVGTGNWRWELEPRFWELESVHLIRDGTIAVESTSGRRVVSLWRE